MVELLDSNSSFVTIQSDKTIPPIKRIQPSKNQLIDEILIPELSMMPALLKLFKCISLLWSSVSIRKSMKQI